MDTNENMVDRKRTPWCDDADNAQRLADSNHPLLLVRAGDHLSIKTFGFLGEPFEEARTRQCDRNISLKYARDQAQKRV